MPVTLTFFITRDL